ncbi:MAG: glycoside hydrolase family 78 protein [Lachnospiraceae bacterium]|nr:glycoside hydrolase family 78 protein [Lachnospiraceae bacterium]
MIAVNPRTEGMSNPLGISITKPLLSWWCKGGVTQTAYELEAFCENELFFASGKIISGEQRFLMPKEAGSRQCITWHVRLWDEAEKVSDWSEWSSYEMGILDHSQLTAKWINPELECDPKLHKPASSLKTRFDLAKTGIGRLYITAHGLYEASINGQRVGDFVLAPGSNNYDAHIALQTYDVTDLLKAGTNEVEVLLGDGWYRSVSGVDGDRNLYGTDVALFFQLEVDGVAVCVSDESWLAAQDSPIRENDMQQGEVVDAGRRYENYHSVKTENFGTEKLFYSNCVPVKEHGHFDGKLMKTPGGKSVFDFGQNLAGYIRFTVKDAKAGDVLVLTHGETLDENGEFTQENFQDRKRHKEGGTKQQVRFTCKEGLNTYKTRFSIWGFRYALLEGDIAPEQMEITAIAVYSDMQEQSGFHCSESLVNQLFSNCVWSMKSNFCDVPTDCPTRERAAWTGDMGVFIETGLYLMDCYPVVRKWLQECRLAQYPDGKVPNIAPRNNNPSFFSGLLAGSVGWGDAVILVPYEMYRKTGDSRILSENYDMMKNWYAFLTGRAKQKPKNPVKLLRKNPYRDYTIETGVDYGEWCEPDVESTSAMRTPQEKVATAYLSYSGKLLSEIASILGQDADAENFKTVSENARNAFRFLALEDGRIKTDRQAELVRAISFNLLDETEKKTAAEDLDRFVRENDYHLNTGFLSTPYLCHVLTEYGYEDSAYRLLLQETSPGWLYEVKKGATSIWENWDGIDEAGKPSGSLNHYSKGAVAAWMIKDICGIYVDYSQEDKIEISPHPNSKMQRASAWVNTMTGQVKSAYEIKDGQVTYQIEVPTNNQVKLSLPGKREEKLSAGTYTFTGPV